MRLSYTQCANNLLINYSFILLNKPITHFTVAEPVALSLQMVWFGNFCSVDSSCNDVIFVCVFLCFLCRLRDSSKDVPQQNTDVDESWDESIQEEEALYGTSPPLTSRQIKRSSNKQQRAGQGSKGKGESPSQCRFRKHMV